MSIASFSKNIYVSPNVSNIMQIKSMLKKRVVMYGVYFICVSGNSKFNMEILEFGEVFKTVNLGKDYIIIGVAEGKRDAFLLVCKIIEDIMRTDRDILCLRQYILERFCNGQA